MTQISVQAAAGSSPPVLRLASQVLPEPPVLWLALRVLPSAAKRPQRVVVAVPRSALAPLPRVLATADDSAHSLADAAH